MDPLEAGRVALTTAVHVYLTGQPFERTGPMKAAGAAVFQARQQFELADGVRDVLGRSSAYRAWLAGVLSSTSLPHERRAGFLSALRHHVSAEMHAHLSPQQLQAHGVAPDDAATRTRNRRQREQLEAGDRSSRRRAPVDDPNQIVDLLTSLTAALGRIRYDAHHPDVEVAIRRLGESVSQLSRSGPDSEVIYF